MKDVFLWAALVLVLFFIVIFIWGDAISRWLDRVLKERD